MANCLAVHNCLVTYAKASGQLINFEKSSLSFSPNTNEQLAENIKSALAVPVVHAHSVYLGLPAISLRSKKLQFRYLVERVAKRIQRWGNKTFSAGGKETLIKSVLQSIPTYALSCFRIPKSVCEEIERECSNFWWGVDVGKKRLHWKSWPALCKPKCMGGLGFRQLETFNQALLAEQIWRVISEPDSLVARVLKGRYFRHQDIMEAEMGSNPSSIWRALMWSRPLLAEGLCWKVGDGARINTFEDIWLPGPRTCLAPIPDYASFSKVKSLMVHGMWNVPLIQKIFSPLIAQKITCIPITPTNIKDARFWKCDPKGMKEKLSKPDFELFVMRTWATWNERLCYLHECNGKARELDADWCENLLREFGAAPYKEGYPSCAVGGVIRDHEGQPILAFGELIDKAQSVTMAELLAI
ncbi:uncharacterized protein [Primulina huaijiensis]|uniref:uncharacterized protein n=1 Tax=Primulina huaijiensis TaxID=1492673 RepID=UPI003CC6E8B5